MKAFERQKKLDKAMKSLSDTRRRINRLLTAEKNWNRRVNYHSQELAKEIAAEQKAATESFKLSLAPLHSPSISGRKFRDRVS